MEFLYLTTIGWKSGKPHEIEIWFVERGSMYYVVSEMGRASHWVQNIIRNPLVSVKVSGEKAEGTGRLVSREAEPELTHEVAALMSSKYKWSDGLIVELAPSRSRP
ncbi:MAG: nitroreductase family deazaflavin-dependent oxidoreductase [Thaumarchaeota archaeon]|nr:nitroreductase family deazaflavin-dependent oxidoreductase [Nitrososphaerota archaeon]